MYCIVSNRLNADWNNQVVVKRAIERDTRSLEHVDVHVRLKSHMGGLKPISVQETSAVSSHVASDVHKN